MNDEAIPPTDSSVLSKFQFFGGFKSDELDTLLGLCESATYSAGEKIVNQGDSGTAMYVILSGRVKVFYSASDRNVDLAELGAGDFFGELALVDDGPRSANVTASETTQTLVVTRMVLGVLAGIKPAAAIHLLAAIGRSLVNRLRSGNQKYLDLILLGHKDSGSAANP